MRLTVLGNQSKAEEGGVMPTARELLETLGDGDAPYIEDASKILCDRVEKVLALHVEWAPLPTDTPQVHRCVECAHGWPCPTVRILNGEE